MDLTGEVILPSNQRQRQIIKQLKEKLCRKTNTKTVWFFYFSRRF